MAGMAVAPSMGSWRALRVHNDAHPGQERIRLRMALHAGEILMA
jgi:hypothetical protein